MLEKIDQKSLKSYLRLIQKTTRTKHKATKAKPLSMKVQVKFEVQDSCINELWIRNKKSKEWVDKALLESAKKFFETFPFAKDQTKSNNSIMFVFGFVFLIFLTGIEGLDFCGFLGFLSFLVVLVLVFAFGLAVGFITRDISFSPIMFVFGFVFFIFLIGLADLYFFGFLGFLSFGFCPIVLFFGHQSILKTVNGLVSDATKTLRCNLRLLRKVFSYTVEHFLHLYDSMMSSIHGFSTIHVSFRIENGKKTCDHNRWSYSKQKRGCKKGCVRKKSLIIEINVPNMDTEKNRVIAYLIKSVMQDWHSVNGFKKLNFTRGILRVIRDDHEDAANKTDTYYDDQKNNLPGYIKRFVKYGNITVFNKIDSPCSQGGDDSEFFFDIERVLASLKNAGRVEEILRIKETEEIKDANLREAVRKDIVVALLFLLAPMHISNSLGKRPPFET